MLVAPKVGESVAPMVAESVSLKVVPKAVRTGYQWVVRKVAQLVALLGNTCPNMSERSLQLLLSSLAVRSAPTLSNRQAVGGSQ